MTDICEDKGGFEGLEIDVDELSKTMSKRQAIPLGALKKKKPRKKKKKITIVPKSQIKSIKRRADDDEALEVQGAEVANSRTKRGCFVDLDLSAAQDDKESVIEELREKVESLATKNERLETQLAASTKSDTETLKQDVQDIAEKISFLNRASDEDDGPPIPPPEGLVGWQKIVYLVNHFPDIATQFARENLLPEIQEQVEDHIAALQKQHDQKINSYKKQLDIKDAEYKKQLDIKDAEYKKQLDIKDAEYENQTKLLEDREISRIQIELDNERLEAQWKVHRKVDAAEFLKKASELSAILQIKSKALEDENRRKELALRKAEIAKEEAKEAKKTSDDLKAQVDQLKSENIALNKKCATLEAKFSRLNGGKAETSDIVSGPKEDSVEDKERTITKLQWYLTAEQEKLKQTKEELHKLQVIHKKMECETMPIAKERDQFRKKLNTSQSKIKELVQKLSESNEDAKLGFQASEYKKKMEEAIEKADKHEKISMKAREAALEATKKLGPLQGERDHALNNSQRCEALAKDAYEKCDKAIQELKKLERENATLERENATLIEYNKTWVDCGEKWKQKETSWVSEKKSLFDALRLKGEEAKKVATSSEHEIQKLQEKIGELTATNQEYYDAIIQLEDMVKKYSAEAISQEGKGEAHDNTEFNKLLKEIALAHVITLRCIVSFLGKIGFSGNEQLRVVAQKVQEFIEALAACEKDGSYAEGLRIIQEFLTQPIAQTKDGESGLFPKACNGIDLCRAIFIHIAERWKTSERARSTDAQEYKKNIEDQRKMYTEELVAFEMEARSVEDGDISKALEAHLDAMEKIKEEEDGIRALSEVQHMQAFVEFIKKNIKWSKKK